MKKNHGLGILIVLWLLLAAHLFASPKDPVEGVSFDNYIKLQYTDLQNSLRIIFPENKGFIVTGPLDPNVTNPELALFYATVRIVCPNLETLLGATELLEVSPEFSVRNVKSFIEYALPDSLPGYRGSIVSFAYHQKNYFVQIQTINQQRFLIWAKSKFSDKAKSGENVSLKRYAAAVSDYLYQIDRNNLEASEPKAGAFELLNDFDLYAKAPDYVIQGYQNYKDYLYAHASVTTDFASRILGFIPTAESFDLLKSQAPRKGYPNKEAALLQEEFRKYLQRGGTMNSLRTLTKEIFDTLGTGEYFFAVGLNGNIRFGRELTREEVAQTEKTGAKPARANHAFLFTGEPILTAGAFFIGCEEKGKLTKVSTQSGHYFYSNITSTIKEDIAERSNSYFLTIGHFFTTLDSLGIVYSDVVVTKL